MRILKILPDGWPTFRPDVTALFGRYLPRHGIQTDLVTHRARGADSSVKSWAGGRLFYSPPSRHRIFGQFRGFGHIVQVLWRTRAPEYDAIQVRDKVFAALPAFWIARRHGLPFFYWMSFRVNESFILAARETGLSAGVIRWTVRMIKGHLGRLVLHRYILPRCTHVFVQSDRMRDDLAALGVSRERMTAVPMGVDLERPLPTRSDASHDARLNGRRVVAYLGGFERDRRLEFLIDVIQDLAAAIPDCVLLMVGDSPDSRDRARLEEHARAVGVADRVIWTGWVDPATAWRWLVNAEVAVSLVPRGALYDGASPTKVIEYLALGIPAVVNDQPDQKSVIDASGAGLCREMNRTDFSAAIAHILLHPDVAQRMSEAGPRYVAAHRSYHQIAERIAQVYQGSITH